MTIDGKKISNEILAKLKLQPVPNKIFAAILVGSNQTAESFLKQKEKIAKELGVDFRIYKFPAELKNDDLRREIGKIALRKKVGGAIVQLPLPEHLNKHYILNAIPREKDVDVLGERALGAFYNSRNPVLPPAVGTVQEIIENCKLKIENLRIGVVGLGFLVGKPIAIWLTARCSEIYLLDQGSDLKILKNADLVIAGTGVPGLIKPEMLKNNTGIIDFGYSVVEMSNEQGVMSKKISGDFDASPIENCKLKIENFWYTPTPGGTGPILVAKLFENFYKLN